MAKSKFFAVATRAAQTLVSVFFVANLASCSGPLAAGEDLDQIQVKADKAIVDVENFSAVEAEQTSNLVFTTSDGNTLRASVIGVTPREVKLEPGAETDELRTINVQLIGVNDDGVQRTARTSYQQRKASADEPAPEPTVIDVRLEADTTMTYYTGTNSNRVLMVINPVKRITTYNNGDVTTEEITSPDGMDVFICGDKDRTDWISNSPNVMECVFWDGTTVEEKEESTYDVRGFEVSERKEYIRLGISAYSDVNAICTGMAPQVVLLTRNVKFTDAESGKSIEWKISGEMTYAGREAIDEGLEPLHEPEGDYKYVGSHRVRLTNTCNGYSFAETVAITAIYNK